MNPTRFPAPTTGLWYWEEESPACTTRATDASQREEQGTEHCGALGIFLVLDRRSINSSAARSGNSPCRVAKVKVEKGKPKMVVVVDGALFTYTRFKELVVSFLSVYPSAPTPPTVSGSGTEERTPRASLPARETQELGGGEEAAPPLRF